MPHAKISVVTTRLLVLFAILSNSSTNRSRTPEDFSAPAMMLAMMLGGAQFSGQVLRKPSVTVYGSVAAALLYVYLHPAPGTGRALEKGRLLVERRGHRPGTWGNRQGGTVCSRYFQH